VLNHERLNVEEACSGLGMLMTFFALATAVAIIVKRPVLDKVVILLSAAPVAVLANVLRIVLTGIFAETIGTDVAFTFYHYGAGLFMVPVALGLIWLELKVIDHLLVAPPPEVPRHEVGLNLGLASGPSQKKRPRSGPIVV
jgi:exosortase/archaeosortase family protein